MSFLASAANDTFCQAIEQVLAAAPCGKSWRDLTLLPPILLQCYGTPSLLKLTTPVQGRIVKRRDTSKQKDRRRVYR